LAASGEITNTLLDLADSADEALRLGIQQTLAQVCITADPALIAPDDQLRAVEHFVYLMKCCDDQLQLDGAMGLTNLLTTGDEVRSLALQAGAWGLCQELLFCQNEAIRRAATEAMCNFTAAPEVVEYFASGQGDLELQGFTSFCSTPDHGTQVAATGALAMLARYPDVAVRIAWNSRCQRLLDVLDTCEDPDIQHRMVSCLHGVYQAPELPPELRQCIHEAFRKMYNATGFVSSEAEALVHAVMDEEA
jgi:hypothetical protein